MLFTTYFFVLCIIVHIIKIETEKKHQIPIFISFF